MLVLVPRGKFWKVRESRVCGGVSSGTGSGRFKSGLWFCNLESNSHVFIFEHMIVVKHGRFRRVSGCAGAGSGGMFWEVPEGSGAC